MKILLLSPAVLLLSVPVLLAIIIESRLFLGRYKATKQKLVRKKMEKLFSWVHFMQFSQRMALAKVSKVAE